MPLHRRVTWLGALLFGASACSGSVVAVPSHGAQGAVDAGAGDDATPAGLMPGPGGGSATGSSAGPGSSVPSSGSEFIDSGSTSMPIAAPSDGGVSLVMGVDASTVALGGVCSAASAVAGAGCGCTRRPGGTASFECPAGVGEFVSAVVGPGGGTLPLAGRMYKVSGVDAQIDIPPTALSTPTSVVLTETAIVPPNDFLDWSPVYRIDPIGLPLAARAQVQFPWSNASGSTSQGLALWFSPDGSCFTRVADSYVNAGFQMGSTTQLGYFIVAVERTSSTSACP